MREGKRKRNRDGGGSGGGGGGASGGGSSGGGSSGATGGSKRSKAKSPAVPLGVTFNNIVADVHLTLSEDKLVVTGEKGYRMMLATHGAREGSWFFEFAVERSGLAAGAAGGGSGVGAKHAVEPHVRLGWATTDGDQQVSGPPPVVHVHVGACMCVRDGALRLSVCVLGDVLMGRLLALAALAPAQALPCFSSSVPSVPHSSRPIPPG